MAIEETLAFMRDHELFKELEDAELRAFIAIGRESSFASGDWLVREGMPGESFYLLLSGKLEVVKDVPTPEGFRRERIAYIDPGETFGEMSVIDKQPRSATVLATQESRVLVFTHEALHGMIHFLPQAYANILRNLAQAVCEKLRIVDARFAISLFADQDKQLPRQD